MKAKTILKVIGRILLVLLLLIVLALLVCSVTYHIKLNKQMQTLKDAGYYHPVSVGDYAVNVYACGNDSGQHTVVALAGWGDGEMLLGWRQMTAELEKENRLIFLDRAGYGLSDDSKQDMTPERVVEDYRTALRNDGIEAPYLLMGHSLGGLYATYWESKYPDEIEGVIFVDGTFCFEIPEEEQLGGGMLAALMPAAEKLGLAPFIIRSDYGRFLDTLPEEQKEQAIFLMSRTLGAAATTNEIGKVDWDVDFVWHEMQPTDIPKCYIEATLGYHSKEDFINDGRTAESLLNVYVDPSMKGADDDAIYEAALKLIEKQRTEWAEPYYEKLGNCEVIALAGDHVIFLDKPQECSRIVTEFISGLDGSTDTHISE